MDKEFSDFQDTVRKTNKTLSVALQCASFVMNKARELPLEERKDMNERVKSLISIGDSDY